MSPPQPQLHLPYDHAAARLVKTVELRERYLVNGDIYILCADEFRAPCVTPLKLIKIFCAPLLLLAATYAQQHNVSVGSIGGCCRWGTAGTPTG